MSRPAEEESIASSAQMQGIKVALFLLPGVKQTECKRQNLPRHRLAREREADDHEAVTHHHHVVDLHNLLPEVRRRLQVVVVASVMERLEIQAGRVAFDMNAIRTKSRMLSFYAWCEARRAVFKACWCGRP